MSKQNIISLALAITVGITLNTYTGSAWPLAGCILVDIVSYLCGMSRQAGINYSAAQERMDVEPW